MLTVGILNNMPDAAVRSTERQFRALFANARRPARLRWFSFDPRHGYEPGGELWKSDWLDGLVVTGTEPRARLLRDEPYWDSAVKTIEWAAAHTSSTIWSCLAAHAAALHLSGVERRPLPAKLCGVFEVAKLADHPLLANTKPRWGVPHSRFNELPPQDLGARGYRILTQSEQAGADTFVRRCGVSLFVFMQGHPEYDARALMREYRRDVLRFLAGERSEYPGLPANYFDPSTHAALQELRERAVLDRSADTMVEMQNLIGQADLPGLWQGTAARLYENWLDLLAAGTTRVMAGAAS
ncbi:MAG: homoserine O-succinyltransferase [Acetobacteraceae bacterium]|nr:homoserine O-succinyltransferase [Acetobacteraceae bacterium]